MKLPRFFGSALTAVLILSLSACGGEDKKAQSVQTPAPQTQNAPAEAAAPKVTLIKAGVVPGPYRGMIDAFIRPELEKQGYKLEFVEFTDYVQPDSALDGGDINFNLMQHQSYLDNIVKDHNLKLVGVINVPTLGLGVFSDKYASFDELPEGATVGIPTDAVNLARSLRIARDLGLITLKSEKSEQKASIADVGDNPKNLRFVPMEAAQISRSLDSIDIGFVPGNYAYAAGLDYSKALGIENVEENIKNVVTVRLEDQDTLGRVLHDIVASDAFKKALEQDHAYDAFTRPQWWNK